MRPTSPSRPRAATLACALLALAACASVPRDPLATPTRGARTSYVLATASLSGDRMLLDVVESRWPRLVRGDLPRGDAGQAASLDRFGVYDARGAFLGGPQYLESVRAGDVRELERLTALEESARFGRRHPAGAVVVRWR